MQKGFFGELQKPAGKRPNSGKRSRPNSGASGRSESGKKERKSPTKSPRKSPTKSPKKDRIERKFSEVFDDNSLTSSINKPTIAIGSFNNDDIVL